MAVEYSPVALVSPPIVVDLSPDAMGLASGISNQASISIYPDNLMLQGHSHSLCATVDMQFVVDILKVLLNCIDADS